MGAASSTSDATSSTEVRRTTMSKVQVRVSLTSNGGVVIHHLTCEWWGEWWGRSSVSLGDEFAVLQRWYEAKALVIDEVSMLDAEFFDKLRAQLSKGIAKGRLSYAQAGFKLWQPMAARLEAQAHTIFSGLQIEQMELQHKAG